MPPLADVLAIATLVPPAALLLVLGGRALVGRPASEQAVGIIAPRLLLIALMACVALGGLLLHDGRATSTYSIGHWATVGHERLELSVIFDRLSVPVAALTLTLTGVVGAFAHRYLHREPGYGRFFILYAVFVLGMLTAVLAATIETLLAGWELVGLSSALLVAFFQERENPVRNGLRVWIVYRLSDLGLIAAAALWRHWIGSGHFEILFGASHWPGGVSPLTTTQAYVIGLLLLLSAIGKSALVPLSIWMPRAMEGPTPSSAIFYGALSVHAGAYLLLRVAPVLDQAPGIALCVTLLGLATALFGTLVGRVQSDIKCSIAYASLTQVGVIVAEIGLGLRLIAVLHILGHACLRTLQFLRAPSLLHDRHRLESAIGGHIPRTGTHFDRVIPSAWRGWLYRFALERGHLEPALERWIAAPVVFMFERLEAFEQRWLDFVGGRTREPRRERDS
jgi:NAD(P)H-quinone oxidoreductase subunit 5